MTFFHSKKNADINSKLDGYFRNVENRTRNRSSLQVLIRSEKPGLAYQYPPDSAERPYHVASIGKVFTSALVCMFAERGRLSLDDQMIRYLSRDQVENLFVHRGVDYSSRVTVRDLLAHTSGAADYFEDPVVKGIPFAKDILVNPDTFWTPDMLLDFSRNNQKAVGRPGDVFHYSDTGYILLGKIMEEVSGKPFHDNLRDEFFDPLGMRDSYLMFRSEPANRPKAPIQKAWLNGVEVSAFRSLSSDWAGGGIVSTASDLLKFQTALRKGGLVSFEMLRTMETCPNTFRTGIRYGLGMMEIRFEKLLFLLKGLPRVTGHTGIFATHMFYDGTSDTHVIMNFGNTALMPAGFRALIRIMNFVKKIPD